jgi:hypothetical protein
MCTGPTGPNADAAAHRATPDVMCCDTPNGESPRQSPLPQRCAHFEMSAEPSPGVLESQLQVPRENERETETETGTETERRDRDRESAELLKPSARPSPKYRGQLLGTTVPVRDYALSQQVRRRVKYEK